MGKMPKDSSPWDIQASRRMDQPTGTIGMTLVLRVGNDSLEFSVEHPQSKALLVNFDQNDDERYQCTLAAYLEVRIGDNDCHLWPYIGGFQDAHFNIVRCRVACHCWSAPYDGETPSPETLLGESDFASLTSSISSLTIDQSQSKSSDLNLNLARDTTHQLGKTVATSNDSGIHEDGLDTNSQSELGQKPIKDTFQLPSWLANNQPIPDELLAKRSFSTHSTYQYLDEDDETNEQQPSSFYAFSFIDPPHGQNEDTWSNHSSSAGSLLNTEIRDEIKNCVETLHSCLDQFREMNGEIDHHASEEPIDEEIATLLNNLIDQVENKANHRDEEEESIESDLPLDYDLLNEFWKKKFTFQEYLTLLDQLFQNRRVKSLCKTGEELSNEILRLTEQNRVNPSIVIDQSNLDANPIYSLSSSPSNYSFLPPLPRSTSMDISFLATNELSNPTQSYVPSSNEKSADIGRCKHDPDEIFSGESTWVLHRSPREISLMTRGKTSRSLNDSSSENRLIKFNRVVSFSDLKSIPIGIFWRSMSSWSEKQRTFGSFWVAVNQLRDDLSRRMPFVCLGPFLRMIFAKLENMLQNSLSVNLLLTGIIARLAHYCQPLLRSFLLNHSLVLETNVKSLFQVGFPGETIEWIASVPLRFI